MGANSNDKKNKQLGMAHGTATNRLRKMIMFQLIQEAGKDVCHQCGKQIEAIENFSIEHKTPWLNSDNPLKLFFDRDNISFSHLKCNISAARPRSRAHPGRAAYDSGCRCDGCVAMKRKSTRESNRKVRNSDPINFRIK